MSPTASSLAPRSKWHDHPLSVSLEMHLARHIGFDHPCDDINRRSLCCHYQMDTTVRVFELRMIGLFDILICHHHQISELVNDDNRQGSGAYVSVVSQKSGRHFELSDGPKSSTLPELMVKCLLVLCTKLGHHCVTAVHSVTCPL